MSGIDASAAVEWPAAYCGGHSAATRSIAALGWWHAPPPAVVVREIIAGNPGTFVDVRWLAQSAGIGTEDRRLVNTLRMAARRGEVGFIDAYERILAVAPALASDWETVVERVFAAIPETGPVAYGAICAGVDVPETTVKTVLQALNDHHVIVGDTAAGPSEWEAMSFSRTATAAPAA
jgi:hypothetical protein